MELDKLKYSFAAFIATLGSSITHPFDVIKTRFQSSQTLNII